LAKNKRLSYIFACVVVFFWATVPSAFKISLRFLSVTELLFYATVVSGLVLFVILWFQGKMAGLKQMKKQDYLFSLLLGFLNPFFYYMILFKAYSLLPAQQAQPLNLTWGIILVLLSVPFLGQKLRLVDLIALLICFTGVMVISFRGDFSFIRISNPLGVALALSSSVIWAFYWVLNVKDRQDPLVRLFLNFAAGSIFILPFFLMQMRVPPVEGLLGAVYVGLLEMGVTFFLWLSALKLADSTAHIVILVYLVPFLSFGFIHILVGEKIHYSSVLGAMLIVIGMVVNKYRELGKERE